jgi:hypothetical protein
MAALNFNECSMSLFEKFKEGFLSQFEATPTPTSPIKIVKQRKSIRKELMDCKENGKVLGIYCPAIGEGMFLAGIDDILITDKGEEVIVLCPYDMNGILIQRNQIAMSEIKSVCPFDTFYIHPITGKARPYVTPTENAVMHQKSMHSFL